MSGQLVGSSAPASLVYQQQGDVYLRRLPDDFAIPAGATVDPTGVVAPGSSSGTAHGIAGGGAVVYRAADGKVFVVVTDAGARLIHGKHLPQDVAPGIYDASDRVQEFDYETEEAKSVID